ncbi:MAG: glycosyltransferase family 2 protein [Pseudomonadota bacterium]
MALDAWHGLPPPVRTRLRPTVRRVRAVSAAVATPQRRMRPHAAAATPARIAASRPARSPVEATVSVVIPTLDAGPQFTRVLAAVIAQEGLRDLEVVVADSGSSDGTREVARAAGAIVLDVAPDAFGHGRTRNVAAERGQGEVVLLLVQDAILLGSSAIVTLVAALDGDRGLAAVTARHVPRTDADLYGAFVVFAHERALAAPRSRAEVVRARAGVDSVCTAVRRAAWEELRFADVPFAEDLDFGVRAIERGWRVRRSPDVAVAHSHTRDPGYHFRRSVADRLHVAPLVGDDARTRSGRSGLVATRVAALRVAAMLEAATAGLPDRAPLADHVERASAGLRRGAAGHAVPNADLAGIAALLGEDAAPDADRARVLAHLLDDLAGALSSDVVEAFARAHPSVSAAAARAFTVRLGAAVLGRAVGDALRGTRDDALVTTLLRGV